MTNERGSLCPFSFPGSSFSTLTTLLTGHTGADLFSFLIQYLVSIFWETLLDYMEISVRYGTVCYAYVHSVVLTNLQCLLGGVQYQLATPY